MHEYMGSIANLSMHALIACYVSLIHVPIIRMYLLQLSYVCVGGVSE